MSLSSALSSLSDSRAIASKLGGTSAPSRAKLFATLAALPVRKKLFGSHAVAFPITFNGTHATLYARDSADIAVLREVFVDGEYELTLPREPRHIVDIGGHAGYVSVYFALTYPHASIRTFEPDAGNFAILERNIAAYPNIVARQAAVSYESGSTRFYSSGSSISSSLKARAGTKETIVDAIALDEILAAQPADLVKFDIEGAEYDLFAGSKLAVSSPFYVGEMHYDLIGKTRDDFLALFPGYGVNERPISAERTIILLMAASRS